MPRIPHQHPSARPSLVEQARRLMNEGKLEEAQALLRHARPEQDPDALHLLAIACSRRGDAAGALALCDSLVQLRPEGAAFWNTRGVVLRTLGRQKEALASYARALALKPDYPDALRNRGNLLCDAGRLGEALESYRGAFLANPADLRAWQSAIGVLQRQGRAREALPLWDEVARLAPAGVETWTQGGGIHFSLHHYQKAYDCWSRAIALAPEQKEVLGDLALICNKLGRWTEAQQRAEQAMALDTEYAWGRMVHLLVALPVVREGLAVEDAGLDLFRTRLAALREWARGRPERGAALVPCITRLAPFDIAYCPGNHRLLLSEYGDFISEIAARHLPPAPGPQRLDTPRERLRLGIASTHISRHSVWDIVLKGIIRHLERSRFELFIYRLGGDRDAQTDWARQQADAWRDVSEYGQDLDRWLNVLRADAPDILFYPELGMNGMSYLLAASRIAPVQAAGWGHPITSGLATVDLYFTGERLEPQNARAHYRETPVPLPGCGCCTDYSATPAEAAPELERLMATIGGVRFLLPHAPFKLHPVGDELLVAIARARPQARFLCMRDGTFAAITDTVVGRIKRAFVRAGLNGDDHVFVLPWQRRTTFPRLLELADVYLDWPTFSGYTTAWHAAHSGLPIVTLDGECMRQRLAAGLLRQIGQVDTIAGSGDEYVRHAVALADERADPGAWEQRRARLRQAADRADRQVAAVRAFEDALTQRYHNHRSMQDPPQPASPMPESPNTGGPPPPTGEQMTDTQPTEYPWDRLDQAENNHWQSLNQNYAPRGLIELLDIEPERGLDVGCFVGATSALIKSRWPNCRMVGIEPSRPAAEVARARVDELHVGLLEEVDFAAAGYGPGHFDVIVLADVLEHMYNPWGALKRLRPYLSPRGCLLASIPNARNLHVLGQLAAGRWRYEPAGLLDVTHIRFFTRIEVAEMFAATGWRIEALVHNPDARWQNLMQARETTRVVRLGKLTLSDLTPGDVAELATLQFFVRVRPAQ